MTASSVLQGIEDIKELSESLQANIILYNGNIDAEGADILINITSHPTEDNVLLILCTPGGDADAAYRIARRLQSKYKKFILYVYGYCKSAGTLIAIGSEEIIMGDFAEFGPLDVQVIDGEEIGKYNSGLNVFHALTYLQNESYRYFMRTLINLRKQGLPTKNAIYCCFKFN